MLLFHNETIKAYHIKILFLVLKLMNSIHILKPRNDSTTDFEYTTAFVLHHRWKASSVAVSLGKER